MTARWLAVASVVALALACSNLNELADGVIALEVRPPNPRVLDYGDTAHFVVIPRNQAGDSVAADVRWRTPDDSVITIVDSLVGLVVGDRPGVGGRVQAVLGDYRTGLDSVTFQVRADTIVLVEPSIDTVLADETASDSLTARLESLDPAGVLAGRPVIYTVVEPVFATAADRTVEFANAAVVDTVLTGPGGTPSPFVTLRRRTGVAAPDSAIVEVRAAQALGAPVPGSGQRFVVHFE